MTERDLAVAAQRILVQDPAFLASGLLGVDETWDQGWIFPNVPGARIENTGKCAIVIREIDPWTEQNPHNRGEFGTISVDIWADPTRNADLSVRFEDARDKIKTLGKIVLRNFHLVHSSVHAEDPSYLGVPGMPRIWGTPAEVAARTGITIVSSQHGAGPSFAPMANNKHAERGAYRFNIQYSS